MDPNEMLVRIRLPTMLWQNSYDLWQRRQTERQTNRQTDRHWAI